jgi:translation initiation factor 5B
VYSLRLIQYKNCHFFVALKKIDRIFGWKEEPNAPFEATLATQAPSAQDEFEQRLRETITLFNAEGLNAEVYYRNKDFKEFISLVPTSAHTGEGIPDMLALIVQLCQKMLGDRIMYREEIQATVLEMRVVEGHGATIDIVLVNGELSVGDTIVVCGFNGPIVTSIRALLTPQPMKEIRVKGTYVSHKKIRAAMGIKIAAQNLDHAIAGGNMLVPKGDDDIQDLEDEVMEDLEAILENDNREERGVYVQASTLGSLEALLSFLIDSKIPYSAVNIGPVHKKDVMKCSTQLEKNKDYACILAFDVKISEEAQNLADEVGITIYWAEIIYHLFDQFTLRMKMLADERRAAAQDEAVFPCAMQIYEQHVFNSRNPLLVGVKVLDGQVRIGTPICVPTADKIVIGKVASIEHDHKNVDRAKKGDDIAVKIEQTANGQDYYYGRHFDHTDHLVSKLTRESIDLLKAHFKDEMEAGDWLLVKKLKPVFGIS